MSSHFLESERLIFRAFQDKDLPFFYALNMDKEVMRYFPNVLTEAASEKYFQKLQKNIEQIGYGFFAVETKATQEFIGFIGLQEANFESHFTPCKEIGWRLRKPFWNRGFATEGATACLKYAFEQLKFEAVNSICPEINIPSERIMQKIGMSKQGTFVHPLLNDFPDIETCVRYKITANEFLINE